MSDHELRDISPQEAWDLMNEDPRALLVDIRSSMEFLFVGHPKGAVHVAWIDEPDWMVNPNFSTEIRKLILGGVVHAGEISSAPIMLICRSGKRTLDAGNQLIEDGLTNIYNVTQGFEGDLDDNHHRSTQGGWRHADLPWEQC
ncbi:MAG TPA: sulfurtransferase [Gammaproteobacteria bacterium]|nr:sulfurtransferase [Gammaproteobacteria bacterium]